MVDFIARGTGAINRFETTVSTIQKTADFINGILKEIGSGHFFKVFASTPASTSTTFLDAKEFVSSSERLQALVTARLTEKYLSIGPVLTKIGTTFFGAAFSSSPYMQGYIKYWEQRIFQALTTLVLSNLQKFLHFVVENSTLFRVEVRLSAPDVVLSPTANELFQLLTRFIRNMLENLKHFPRWMHGIARLASPRLASPRLASPRLASPRLSSPLLSSPLLSSPLLSSPLLSSPQTNSNELTILLFAHFYDIPITVISTRMIPAFTYNQFDMSKPRKPTIDRLMGVDGLMCIKRS